MRIEPRDGETPWIEYTFAQPVTVSTVAVYWFDSGGWHREHPPEAWQVLCRDGEAWKPVAATGGYGTACDTFNQVAFAPVTTSALRLHLTPRDGATVGVLEWTVDGTE